MSTSTVAQTIKSILEEKEWTQKDLAVAMDVPLDRIKNLATGRVQHLTQREMTVLVNDLDVCSEHLATGHGEVIKQPATITPDYDTVMLRLKEQVNAKSFNELGRMLGFSSSALANRKRAGSLPYDAIFRLAATHNLSMDDLFAPTLSVSHDCEMAAMYHRMHQLVLRAVAEEFATTPLEVLRASIRLPSEESEGAQP